jgi:aspartate 1-decarboxylase
MQKEMFLGKIHRATITHADLEYEGSVTIDKNLMEAADIWENEKVHIWNITQGSRLVTYALEGPRGSGVICVNGAAAHLNSPGDMCIIATFGNMEIAEARNHVPKVILVNPENKIVDTGPEIPGPQMPRKLTSVG